MSFFTVTKGNMQERCLVFISVNLEATEYYRSDAVPARRSFIRLYKYDARQEGVDSRLPSVKCIARNDADSGPGVIVYIKIQEGSYMEAGSDHKYSNFPNLP